MVNFSSVKFFVSEAVTNCRRAGLMTFITISTISVALLLMGGFLLATLNMESFLNRMREEALVTAFMIPDADSDQVKNVKMRITSLEEVSSVQIVTPDEAAKELFLDPTDQKLLQIGISSQTNPLPTTIRMKIRSSQDIDGLIRKLKDIPGIESITYGEEAFKQFQGLSELLWIGSLLVIILLGLSSLFIVYNTVRLTLFMRREEIIIMRLVGATNWFIRWPFIMEGFLQGIAGAIIALILLLISYRFMLTRLSILIPFFTFDLEWGHLIKLSVKLFLMGMVLGISGSLLSLRDLRSFSRNY